MDDREIEEMITARSLYGVMPTPEPAAHGGPARLRPQPPTYDFSRYRICADSTVTVGAKWETGNLGLS